MNPTTYGLEKRIATLEGGSTALVIASVHAAKFIALNNILQSGDNFVSSLYLYGLYVYQETPYNLNDIKIKNLIK